MDCNFGISGKKYLVTGASSGIGQAAVILISKCGGRVVLNGRNKERLQQTHDQMAGEGHFIMPYDLTDLEGMKQYVKDCIDTDGRRFDGMVFSTGIGGGIPIRTEKLDNLKNMMEVSFYHYFVLLKEFSSRRVLNDNGSIVAVSSSCVVWPGKSQMSYASSKAALDLSSQIAAKEFLSRKIRVNTVRPIALRSMMTEIYFSQASAEEIQKNYPLGVLEAGDVANSIVFLLSDMSSKITGQHIFLTAGGDGSPMDFFHLS